MKFFIIVLSMLSGTIMASEFDSRQAFLLINAEPGESLRLEPKDPEIPRFFVDPSGDYILIPVSPGLYSVGNLDFFFEAHRINLISLKHNGEQWVKSTTNLEDAKSYMEENYPVLKLGFIEK